MIYGSTAIGLCPSLTNKTLCLDRRSSFKLWEKFAGTWTAETHNHTKLVVGTIEIYVKNNGNNDKRISE